MSRYFFIGLVALLGLSFGVVKLIYSEPPSHEGSLVVGLHSGYLPFEFRDSKGDLTGFDVELSQKIAERIGKELVIVDMEFGGLILSLKQGKIDCILSGMNITPSRLKEIALIPYYGETATSLSLIFWGEIPDGVAHLEDIGHLGLGAVSVQTGTISEAFLKRHPAIPSKSFQETLSPLLDVKYGKSIANLIESDVAEYLESQHPEIKVMEVPLGPEDQILGFGIGIKKENKELIEQICEAIEALKATHELQDLEVKWFQGEEST